MTNINDTSVTSRFNSIQWHDSKLVACNLLDKENTYRLELRVQIISSAPTEAEFTDALIVFEGCRVFICDLDLLGIELCGGDIGGAICYKDSSLKKQLIDRMSSRFDLPEVRSPWKPPIIS